MKLIALILIVAGLSSCGSYPCAKHPGLQLNFVSFTDTEIESFHIIRYTKGSQFRDKVDSLIVDSGRARFNRRNDTLFLVMLSQEVFLTSNYDYRITLPSVPREYLITEIVEEMQSARKSLFARTQDMCINPIRSFSLNGVKYTATSWSLFLKK